MPFQTLGPVIKQKDLCELWTDTIWSLLSEIGLSLQYSLLHATHTQRRRAFVKCQSYSLITFLLSKIPILAVFIVSCTHKQQDVDNLLSSLLFSWTSSVKLFTQFPIAAFLNQFTPEEPLKLFSHLNKLLLKPSHWGVKNAFYVGDQQEDKTHL